MKGLALLGFSIGVATIAFANDADVSVSGSPKLLSGHKSVRMEREKIVMTIGPADTVVVCDFWFKNDGPACSVRMGFPDEGNQTEEIDESGKMTSNFRSFKSWVDGKPTPTKLERGEGADAWQVKTVKFGAHATVHVRDRYVAKIDAGLAGAGHTMGNCKMAFYTVHTGSSWKGTIGRTEIQVTFDRKVVPAKLKLVPSKSVSTHDDGRQITKAPFPSAGTVVYRGVSKPEVRGRVLRFVRTNWRPTRDDDLALWFGYVGAGK